MLIRDKPMEEQTDRKSDPYVSLFLKQGDTINQCSSLPDVNGRLEPFLRLLHLTHVLEQVAQVVHRLVIPLIQTETIGHTYSLVIPLIQTETIGHTYSLVIPLIQTETIGHTY